MYYELKWFFLLFILNFHNFFKFHKLCLDINCVLIFFFQQKTPLGGTLKYCNIIELVNDLETSSDFGKRQMTVEEFNKVCSINTLYLQSFSFFIQNESLLMKFTINIFMPNLQ